MTAERGPALDLADHPFTQPGSRLLVFATAERDGLWFATAEYERPVSQCRLLSGLRLVVDGSVSPVRVARPAYIEFEGGATLGIADDEMISLSIPQSGATIILELIGAPTLWSAGGRAPADLPGRSLRWAVTGASVTQRAVHHGATSVALEIAPSAVGARLVLVVADSRHPTGEITAVPRHEEVIDRSRQRWEAWFGRRPRVRADLDEAAELAWWVLGANQIRVRTDPARLIVAPSKLGYVAAWQWDSYFIAVGLRHGDPDLAWNQIAFFLDHQRPDGQMPDLVSDVGSVASVRDLPPRAVSIADRQNLDMPITKPPLTAWAAWEVHRYLDDPTRIAWALPRIEDSQRWWTTRSDLNGDGLSEYGHRFSSGLDDSPLFDHGGPVESPDLNAYLVVQDDRMARMADRLGRFDQAAGFSASADERTRRLVARRWDKRRNRFRAMVGQDEIRTFTPFHLMPLLTGRLPNGVATKLATSIRQPRQFWSNWPVPTVSLDDPAFNPERMWRGPVWLNVNRLLAEGLAASGHGDLSRELVEKSLAMVVQGRGMYEHWNPLTGGRPASATSCFSWSAALFIDLAVSVTTTSTSENWTFRPLPTSTLR